MRDCNIIINNDGTVTVSKVNEYIEEHSATRLVITLNDELKSEDISYYTLCFKPGAALKNPPNVKITTDMITEKSTLGTFKEGVITYSLPYEVTRFGSLDVQVQAYISAEDDSLAAIIKSPVFRLGFEPSVTGEEDIVIRDSDGFIDLIHVALAQLNMTIEEADALCDKINEAYENGELNGPVIMPHVSPDGIISWSNDAGMENPEPVNIKGPKGDKGDKGDCATINGCNAVTVKAGSNLKITQDGETLTLNIDSVPVYYVLPEDAENGDVCLYAPQNTLTPDDSGKRICFDWEKFNSAINENSCFDIQLFNGEEPAGMISITIVFNNDLTEIERGIFLVRGSEEWFINFRNGEFDCGSSYYCVDGKYETLSKPVTYFDLPEFDSVQTDQNDVNGAVFFTVYKPMVYFGEWVELSGSSHAHGNKDVLDSIGFDDDGRVLINGDLILTDSSGVTREEWDENNAFSDERISFNTMLAEAAHKTRVESSETTLTLVSEKYYIFGEVESLTIDLAAASDELSVYLNEYSFTFISGATPTVLTLPSSVQWANELTVEANKRYEISIVDNIGLWCAVDYTAEVSE